MKRKNKIIVILGPTSSGKSDLAVFLACKFDGEIISADSRQVYKYMNIGTGKVPISYEPNGESKKSGIPNARPRGGVTYYKGIPHYLLDVAHPSRQFTVVQFKKKALSAIKKIHKKDKLPILAGGTGFYIQSVVDDLQIPEVPANKVLRNQLRNKSAEELFQKLQKLDPRRAESIDHKNKRRLIRALEIIAATGKPVPTKATPGVAFDVLIIGIDVPSNRLNKRIEVRLDKRLSAGPPSRKATDGQGMIKEVKDLHEKHRVSWKRLENFGLEYKWVARYLQKKITKDEMYEKLLRDIKRYARRQMTWFKRDTRIHWIKTQREAANLTKNFLK